MTLYRWFLEKLDAFHRNHFTRVLFVKGRLEPSGQEIRCLFAGLGTTPRYLARKLFPSDKEILSCRRIWIPQLKNILSHPSNDLDVCIADLPVRYDRMFENKCAFKSTKVVRQIVDISATTVENNKKLKNKMRETVRKIKRNGYSFRISREEGDLKYFYDRMFVPHTRKQFEGREIVDSFEKLKRYIKKGALLFVLEKDRPVAGALILFGGKSLVYKRIGVLDGDRAHIKNGAQSAAFHFMIQYAKENAYQSVDFLESLAFLNDGVYIAKRDWGADTYVYENAETYLYYFNRDGSERIADIYARILPIVFNKEGRLTGVVGIPGEESTSLQELENKYCGQGIHAIAGIYGNAIRGIGIVEG